ncbi:hypothetical protein [Phyllobacterium sp. YR531]|uniref:hypothetical protein n=1 Tax=Phyllobacterium sp. YR531 TaxID=1144343 RepID=UPI0012F6C5E0|nr:hypothetical protein [Phyllobacterium sp. YR531]
MTLSIAFYVVFAICMIVTAIVIERKSAMALLHNMLVLIKQNRGTVIVFSIAISEVFALGVIFVAFVLGWKAR